MNLPQLASSRCLCFGGSFNPIHAAHLICARAAAESAGFNKVLLIPSHQPPHKRTNADIASPQHRLEMCRLAVADDPLFEVTDLELLRTGPSYTIDTIRQLKSNGWSSVHWLIGADMLNILPKWHEPQALMAEAHFLIMSRPGWTFDWTTLPHDYQRLQQAVVATPSIQISATDIRQRLRAGRSIRYLVPEPVRQYIEQNRVYEQKL